MAASASIGPPEQRRDNVLQDAPNSADKRARDEGAEEKWIYEAAKRHFGDRDCVSIQQLELEKKKAQLVTAVQQNKKELKKWQTAGQAKGPEGGRLGAQGLRLQKGDAED
ncbi:hypothetical protein Rt10032_c03g1431 [Rhodotorula toruloides]|uniref:Uncharacterized protein n=1 Tax=Rhodotorula toruloides TaxID=5286 RepID=A0A511KDD9_RHOTO|nr:hypothetical protein Rt10032_c03g1431 [Rhodotorula toruloides]